jgi:hypothetical protein
MYGLVYSNLKEGFAASGAGSSPVATVLALVVIALVIVVQLFVVRWLWNTVLVRVTSVVRPIPSLLYTLGLLVLVAMVHPGCAI